MLALLGAVLLVVGLLISFGTNIPYLGKFPGDFHFKNENFEVYVPLATSLALSLLLSGIFWIVSYFQRRGR